MTNKLQTVFVNYGLHSIFMENDIDNVLIYLPVYACLNGHCNKPCNSVVCQVIGSRYIDITLVEQKTPFIREYLHHMFKLLLMSQTIQHVKS